MSISSDFGRRSPLAKLVLASVLVVGSAVAVAGTAGATAPPMPRGAATRLIQPTAAEVSRVISPVTTGDALGKLQLLLMREFPGSFGGIYVNRQGGYVVATDGPASASLMRAVGSGFVAVSLAFGATYGPLPTVRPPFVDTGASLAGLYRLKAAILFNPALRAKGVDGAGLDVERGRVVVFSRSRAGEAAVRADYGDAVSVMLDRRSVLTSARFDDSAPWNGGDEIVTPSFGETTCTSGFGLEDPSTGDTYLLSAGHCGTATWYNTLMNDPDYSSSNLIGSTVAGSAITSTVDAQLISTKSSCISWGGRSTNNSNAERIYITGYSDPPQGAAVLSEGSQTLGEAGSVAYYDISKVVAGEHLSDLDFITATPILGDSGGPVVYPTIYGPLAGGTIVAYYADNAGAYGVTQLIDSELYTYSAFTGDTIVPNTSPTGNGC